jgi:glycosyltransferase 2 family protein
MLINITISAVRWHVLLAIHGAHVSLGYLHRLYFVAAFFNNFLPTGIGGDAYRMAKAMETVRPKTVVVVTVVAERLTGIATLITLGLIGSLVSFLGNGDALARRVLLSSAAGAACLGAGTILIAQTSLLSRLTERLGLSTRIADLTSHLAAYRQKPWRTIQVIVIGLGFHIFSVLWLQVLFGALGASSSFPELLTVAAVTALASLLPVTINGLGVQDAAFVYSAGHYGINYNTALLAAALIRLLLVPISLVGGYLYVKGARQ